MTTPNTPLTVVFFGTPAFSVPTLIHLLGDDRFKVLAVVSQPDKPAGRGHKLQATPVKQTAEAAGLPVFQPVSIRKDDALLDTLRQLKPDVFVTIAFGQILSQAVLDIPRLGTVNVHASLLPRHRGANPIQCAIIHGDAETGLTTMLTDIGVDTGAMLLKATTPITPDDTAITLADRLSQMGGQLLVDTLSQLEGLTPTPQDNTLATHAPKLSKADADLDWSQPATVVLNRIRGQQPWPGVQVQWPGEHPLKILAAQPWDGASLPAEGVATLLPGVLRPVGSKHPQLCIGTGTTPIELTMVQPAGKKAMAATDWLRGLSHDEKTAAGLPAPTA
jgi:methionyl-tRNA formyltransferase